MCVHAFYSAFSPPRGENEIEMFWHGERLFVDMSKKERRIFKVFFFFVPIYLPCLCVISRAVVVTFFLDEQCCCSTPHGWLVQFVHAWPSLCEVEGFFLVDPLGMRNVE